MKKINILDCTLRDGGLGLEDAAKNGLSDAGFTLEDTDNMIEKLAESELDIVELGSIEITPDDRRKYNIYQSIEEVSKKIPDKHSENQMFVALFRGPDTDMDDIPDWHPGLCEGLRVIIRYSELKKSMDFCAGLAQKGYKVFVQPMLTTRYTDEEIDFMIEAANNMHAFALYFVDSYGFMDKEDVRRFSKKYDDKLLPEIKIGFHAHNNMNLAYSNALEFIECKMNREIIIDCCMEGMGQGAGNLQTELIVSHLNKDHNKTYNYKSILEMCEIVEKFIDDNLWGYSVTRLLPAIYKTAYKFSVVFRNKYKLTYVQMNEIFMNMSDTLRNRYLPEIAHDLVEEHLWLKNEKVE